MTCFLWPEIFVHFKKHPKAVSGALRDRFRAREVFGFFEKRTPEVGLKPFRRAFLSKVVLSLKRKEKTDGKWNGDLGVGGGAVLILVE